MLEVRPQGVSCPIRHTVTKGLRWKMTIQALARLIIVSRISSVGLKGQRRIEGGAFHPARFGRPSADYERGSFC